MPLVDGIPEEGAAFPDGVSDGDGARKRCEVCTRLQAAIADDRQSVLRAPSQDEKVPKPTSDRTGPIAFPREVSSGVRGSKPAASCERGQEGVSRRMPASGLQLGAVFLDRLCKSAIDS